MKVSGVIPGVEVSVTSASASLARPVVAGARSVGEVTVFLFFVATLVFPELSQEYGIRIGEVGVLYLHDLLFLALIVGTLRNSARVLTGARRQLLPIYLFVLLIPVEGALGYANGNPLTYVLREVRFLGYSLFFFVTLAVYRRKEERFVSMSLLVATLVAVRGLYEHFTKQPLIVSPFYAGDQLPPVLTADGATVRSYSSPILLFSLAYAFVRTARSASILHLVLTLIYAGSIVFSFARNLYLGVLVALLALLLIQKRMIRGTLLALGGLLAANAVVGIWSQGLDLWQQFLSRFTQILSFGDLSAVGRLVEVGESVKAFAAHPVLGFGLGYRLDLWTLPIQLQEITDIHNTYLYFLAKTGLVGTALLLAVLLSSLRFSYRSRRDDALAGPIFASLLGYCVIFSFAHHLSGSFFTAWFFALLGVSYLVFQRCQRGAMADA